MHQFSMGKGRKKVVQQFTPKQGAWMLGFDRRHLTQAGLLHL
jgi:hypothetical protein